MNLKLTKKLLLTAALFSGIGAASLARADDFGGPSVGPAFVAPDAPTPSFSETPGNISTAPLTVPEASLSPSATPSSSPEATPSFSDGSGEISTAPLTVPEGSFEPSDAPNPSSPQTGELQPVAADGSLKDTLSDNGALADGPNLDAAPPVLERPAQNGPTFADKVITKAALDAARTYVGTNGNVGKTEEAAGRALLNPYLGRIINIEF